MAAGRVIALVGAESTGKTTLAAGLQAALQREGHRVAVVDEYLRTFCDAHRRTPTAAEQPHIAAEQTRRIAHAAAGHDLVVADTTALMTAVYSQQVFGDLSLHAAALEMQRGVWLTLLTAVDLPWQADGLQRDGPQVREPVDALLRDALQRAQLPHAVVAGHGAARLDAALRAVHQALRAAPQPGACDAATQDLPEGAPPWVWCCERCGDAGCERASLQARRGGLFTRL